MQQRTEQSINTERRRFHRWHWQADIQGICLDSRGRRVIETLKTLDISRCGMGAMSSHPHAIGQNVVIGLLEPSGRTHYVHATVVRCENDEQGTRLGLEFKDSPAYLGYWLNERLRNAA
jgi:hypothetical protein